MPLLQPGTLGLYDEAHRHAKKAVEMDPNDLRLRENLRFTSEKVQAA